MGKVAYSVAGGKLKKIRLGSSPCNIKKLLPTKYKRLTIDNFALEFGNTYSMLSHGAANDAIIPDGKYAEANLVASKSYDAETGIFSYTQTYNWNHGHIFSQNGHCYGNTNVTAYLYYIE